MYIPKLSISGTYDLKKMFMNLGVTDVFSDWADLSGITGKPDLKISRVSLSTEMMVCGFLDNHLSLSHVVKCFLSLEVVGIL